ncbi:RDD family protein [Ruficoccus amylovorans]|uniref:RDD family protein n=1 Tax=Ruficoccus amylovorans TaxID=1804625 RepID=A0A842HJ08_9BACT|nr:RDD family protein [Ruficoccus amylovorans]MBC2596359.1 RDD family protein [Ruficoccus amylovorans]
MPDPTPPGLPRGSSLPPLLPQPRLAGMGVRMLAFLMDFVLVFFFTLFLLVKVLLPQYHYEGMQEFIATIDGYAASVEEAQLNGEEPPPVPQPTADSPMVAMLAYAWEKAMLIFWIYFGLVEALFKGSTLGKRTFGLRTVKAESGQPAHFFESVLRGAVKTLALLFPIPLPMLWWINYFVPFFNRRRRAGHDFICRTVVVAE